MFLGVGQVKRHRGGVNLNLPTKKRFFFYGRKTAFRWYYWCPRPDLNRHDRCGSRDFKSLVSTISTTRALEACGKAASALFCYPESSAWSTLLICLSPRVPLLHRGGLYRALDVRLRKQVVIFKNSVGKGQAFNCLAHANRGNK